MIPKRKWTNWGRQALREYQAAEAPITYTLIGILIGVYLFEVGFTLLYSVESIETFSTGLFGVAPYLAWPLSPVLHRGPLHFLPNTIFLFLLGVPIERHWSRVRYALFLFVAGYLSTVIGAAILVLFADKPVAFYGSSGMTFALSGFALTHLLWDHTELGATEWLAAIFGFAALIEVIVDPMTGPYFMQGWINGGHTFGFLIGSVAGWLNWSGCGSPPQKRRKIPTAMRAYLRN